MITRSKLLLFTALCVPAAFSAPAQTDTTLTVTNPGFETAGAGVLPADWRVVSADGSGAKAGSATDFKHSGSLSLKIDHPTPASTSLESSPIALRIGRPYRVSAWARTANVKSDPTARYPVAIPATLTMASFPFTNHSTTLGATHEWTRLTTTFIATTKEDRVRIHLGLNGSATGSAWFDDVAVQEITDISEIIPYETVRWHGPAFSYTDRGWTFVHIEGKPYERGFQYGHLLAAEIASYIDKLAVRASAENPESGWNSMRTMADALMLRGYKEEYLEEMRGIADGAAKADAKFGTRALDFLDVVTMNSAVDLGQMTEALSNTPHALSGRTFRQDEDEAAMRERLHKCSSFLANGPATADGGIVFGQLFMWGGYTGVHWDIVCDVVPTEGHRLVYETFPGGIHSGADFYINYDGIMIGETTVMQTPFDPTGTPQSSRIREAAQYASSIDDVVRILTTKNNGLYTNDWLIGDARTDEIAILLLGTKKHKLWRSGAGEFPGDTKGFYWSINNAKDPEVRKEYVPDPSNAPFDVVFTPWNRDLSFLKYYEKTRGSIDAVNATRVLASSPINRPHACDGKVTTSAMAQEMVFLANYGKVTLREKFPEKGSRLMPDLPNAQPHLSLGYSTFSPKHVCEMLKAKRTAEVSTQAGPAGDQEVAANSAGSGKGDAGEKAIVTGSGEADGNASKSVADLAGISEAIRFDKNLLWSNTVYPAGETDNWFTSASAGYWRILEGLPSKEAEAASYVRDQLAELNCRLLYVTDREGSMAPKDARRRYDGYRNYQVPRIRGIFALHQLRLALGNQKFSAVMNDVHSRFAGKEMSTKAFLDAAGKTASQDLRPIVLPWLERSDLPDIRVSASFAGGTVADRGASPNGKRDSNWTVLLSLSQNAYAYRFATSVLVETETGNVWQPIAIGRSDTTLTISVPHRPIHISFNAGNDVPVRRENFYTHANYFDDFDSTLVIYGTSQQDDANHTLALRYQTVLADAFTENLPTLRKDSEVSPADLASHDLIVLGGAADNTLTQRLAQDLGIEIGRNSFTWKDKAYAAPDDGAILVFPNPYNPRKVAYLLAANSALQLYNMTRRHQPVHSWGIFKGAKLVEKGYHGVKRFEISLGQVSASQGATPLGF